jgi:hypothetical protein
MSSRVPAAPTRPAPGRVGTLPPTPYAVLPNPRSDVEAAVSSDLQLQPEVTTTTRVHRRRGWLLLAVAVFQLWLWGTRIANLLESVGSFSAAFVAVHAALYVTAIGVALVIGVLGWRMVAEARRSDAR